MTVEIWHAAVSSDAPGDLERTCESWLTPDEVAAADRLRRPTTRNQHVVGRGMTRRLLASPDGDPRSLPIGFDDGGKPNVAGCPDPFNVSHTDGMVVLAKFGREGSIGIDVEDLDRRIPLDMADRYFATPETAWVHAARDDADAGRRFLTIWTLKESFIKAIGTGMRTPLADFAFRDADARPRLELLSSDLRSQFDAGRWTFHTLSLTPRYLVSVAVDRPIDVPPSLHAFDSRRFA